MLLLGGPGQHHESKLGGGPCGSLLFAARWTWQVFARLCRPLQTLLLLEVQGVIKLPLHGTLGRTRVRAGAPSGLAGAER